MERLSDRKESIHTWIGNVVSCLWQGLEAVSGEILFV